MAPYEPSAPPSSMMYDGDAPSFQGAGVLSEFPEFQKGEFKLWSLDTNLKSGTSMVASTTEFLTAKDVARDKQALSNKQDAITSVFSWEDMFKGLPDLLTAKEIAFVLRVNEKTVFSWQDLPRVRIRGNVRYHKGQVILWLRKQDWPRPYRRGKKDGTESKPVQARSN